MNTKTEISLKVAVRFSYFFSVMIQKQFFRVFQLFDPEVKHFYQKNT